jgi:hypothetical protein
VRASIRSFTIFLILSLFLVSSLSAAPTWDPNLTPVKVVSSNDKEIVLDNVRWGMNFDGENFSTRYRRTKIRYDQVESVLFCAEDFPPKFVASHIYLTFIFKNDLGMQTLDGKHTSRGLVISATNRLQKGESPSSLAKAFFPKRTKNPWPLVFEVGTLEDRLQNSLLVAGNDIKMYPLKIDARHAETVLRSGIQLSLVDRSKDFYHVLFNNCVVSAFKILKEGLGEKYFPDFWAIKNKMVSHKVSLPKLSAGYLRKRGLGSKRIDIANNARQVCIPSRNGNLFFNITKMPGFARATKNLLPFALKLQNYYEFSQASSDLQKLVDLIGITHPDCFEYLSFKSKIDAQLSETITSLLTIARQNPVGFSDYYVDAIKRNKLNRKAGFEPLNKAFIKLLNFESAHNASSKATLDSNLAFLTKFNR